MDGMQFLRDKHGTMLNEKAEHKLPWCVSTHMHSARDEKDTQITLIILWA